MSNIALEHVREKNRIRQRRHYAKRHLEINSRTEKTESRK